DYKVTGVQTCALPILAEGVAALCRRAAERDLTIVLEFVPYTGLPDLAFTQQVVEASGQPNCALMLDVFHFDRTGGSAADIRRLRSEERRVGKGCRSRG